MKYSIKKLKEIRFEFYNPSQQELTPKNIILDTDYDADIYLDANEISIFFHCIYGIQEGKKKAKQILHSDIIVDFKLKGFPKNKEKKKEAIAEIFPNLLGITISTLRGIIYTRTKGEEINDFVLPILNPTQMILDKKKEK